MQKVAIFDIDGTVFRSSLLIELTDALVQEGIFPSKVRKIYVRACKDWLDRKRPYEDYIGAVIKGFDRNIKGVKYEQFSKVAKKVAAFHKNRIYKYSSDLIKNLKKKNYYLLAISHSPQKVVKEFGKKLGFNKIYGRIVDEVCLFQSLPSSSPFATLEYLKQIEKKDLQVRCCTPS